ncbi:CerR family C-terminal domain-containing protein [Achromobacter kerstersii]|uniref:HTH-type transcriptional dual regulator CecR n=1 Tax=Achromobacter kerstersii TaxID=1353890 RepID=A0A6S6ZRI7_9BURK|nr:CerR family C-terminal domain-containing protein [Achromobacter kerstersii]CAB3681865.1 HTH-type transcriptional dual regulator CecR [Achromobacter kerstersii]
MHDQDTLNARSRETRDRLIRAGLALFSRHGLDGVRTRQLVDEAGVNQSAIPYHFGGKDGVYAAVLEQVAAHITERLGLPRPAATSPDSARAALQLLMQDFVSALLDSEASAASSLLLAREQLQPTEQFDALYGQLFQPLHETIANLVADIRGQTHGDRDAILRAHAILGQALAFAVAREALLRRLGVQSLSPKDIQNIVQMVGNMAISACS